MDKATQHKQIREYLWKHGTMTALDAVHVIGTLKLATRIGEMERNGMIRVEHVREKDPKSGKWYMRYNLVEE